MHQRSLRRILRSPLLLLVAVTAVKIAAVCALEAGGIRIAFVGDNARSHYLPIADRLVSEGRFNGPDSRPDSKVPLGYPAFLALLKGVGGTHDLMLIVCLQMVADLVVGILLVTLGTGLGHRRAGVLAGLGWVLFPPAIVLSTWVTAETLFTCVLLASLVLLTAAIQKGSVWWALGAGVLLGVATLFRGTCILLPIALTPLWLWPSLPRGWLYGLAFATGMGGVVAPWAIRNSLVLDDQILVSVGFGSAFLQGSHEDVFTIEGKRTHYPKMYAEAAAAGIVRPTTDRESEFDSWMMRVGIHNYQRRWTDEPWSLVSFTGVKLARLWYGTESGSRSTQLGLLVCSLFIVPVAVWQLVAWRRSLPRVTLLYSLTLLYFVILHVVTLPEYRYMHPIFPVLMFGAMSALCRVFRSETPSGM